MITKNIPKPAGCPDWLWKAKAKHQAVKCTVSVNSDRDNKFYMYVYDYEENNFCPFKSTDGSRWSTAEPIEPRRKTFAECVTWLEKNGYSISKWNMNGIIFRNEHDNYVELDVEDVLELLGNDKPAPSHIKFPDWMMGDTE